MQYQQIFVHVAAPELQRHVVLPVRIDPELEFDAAALPGGRGAGQKDSGGLIQTAPDDFAVVALQPVTFFGTGFAELNRVVNCRPALQAARSAAAMPSMVRIDFITVDAFSLSSGGTRFPE